MAGDWYGDGTYSFEYLTGWDAHLYDANGNRAQLGQVISDTNTSGEFYLPPEPASYAYFRGANVSEVLNGALGNQLPITGWEGSVADLSHIELRNSMMSHQYYRNWGTYMEAELAALQDIGVPIDRRAFFGYSEYRDGVIVDNYNGYSARNASGTAYLPDVYSTVPFGIGLHIYGDGNIIRQHGDILSNGYGAAGIRMDGLSLGNRLTIMPDVKVHANGADATGLMVTYGTRHRITHRGDISATGPGGVGVRFDFGDNMMGSLDGYRGSYINMKNGNNITLLPELKGPLVSVFNVTGSISGDAAAIYISKNALVLNINFMQGAMVYGDIISDWDPDDPMVQESDPWVVHPWVTHLNFGYEADGDGENTGIIDDNFSMTLIGNIEGRKGIVIHLSGGKLTHMGNANVDAYIIHTGNALASVIGGATNIISANEIQFQILSEVSVQGGAFSYGDRLSGSHTVLLLDTPLLTNDSVAIDSSGTFSAGVYDDYSYSNVRWEDGKTRLVVDISGGKFNKTRAGVSALGAPVAIALVNPASQAFFGHIGDSFQPQALPARLFPITKPASGNNIWALPQYAYSKYSGEYSVSAPAISAGYDLWLNQYSFGGMAISAAFPDYESDDADVSGQALTIALYGGVKLPLALDLGLFASYGSADLDQVRRVNDESYSAKPSMDTISFGLSLARDVALAESVNLHPFANYEYISNDTGSRHEGSGVYALDVDGYISRIHRVTLGAKLDKTFNNGLYAATQLYYSGLYGDRDKQATARFTNAAQYDFSANALPQERNSLGIGLSAGMKAGENVELSINYDYLGGSNIKSHQGYAQVNYRF
jgi:hypothetical protein